MSTWRRRRVAVLGTLGLLIVACGGGGGGGDAGPTPEGPFLGSYHYVRLDRDRGADTVRSETGRVSSDGLGVLTFGSGYAAEEGTATGPFTAGDLAYVVAGAQDLAVVEPGGRSFEGRVASDGRLACAAVRLSGDDPGMFLFVRHDASPTQSDLEGNWYLLDWGRHSNPSFRAVAGEGHIAIDAAGSTVASAYHYNRDGAIDPVPSPLLAEQLLVDAEGWVIRRPDAGSPIYQRGAISTDHDLIVLGMTGGTAQAGVTILVRGHQASGDTDLDGSYRAAGFESAAGGGYGSTGGSVSLLGNGGGSWNLTACMEGVTANRMVDVDYTVIGDGSVGFSLAGSADTQGAVGRNGQYVVHTGYFTATEVPSFSFWIR